MITVLSGGRRWNAGVVVGAAAGQLLSSHFLLLPALVLPTLRVAWQDGGKGLLIREVGGGSTQASRDPLPAAQAGNTILVLCSALVLCFALVLWFALTISSYDEIAG